MILVLDVGNTHTVLGVFYKGKWVLVRRFTSSMQRTEDEAWVLVRSFVETENLSLNAVNGTVIASVVPFLTDIYIRMVEKYLEFKPMVISGDMELEFKIPYQDPSKLGADRICAITAARKKFGGPAIIVDFGTATTFDVISNKGEYLGGIIAPGIVAAGMSLTEKASLLPRPLFQFPAQIIGNSTQEAIQSGIMYQALDGFEGMVRRLRRVAGKYTQVIATGGFSSLIMEMTNEIKYLEPNLVLEGARIIFEKSGKKTKK